MPKSIHNLRQRRVVLSLGQSGAGAFYLIKLTTHKMTKSQLKRKVLSNRARMDKLQLAYKALGEATNHLEWEYDQLPGKGEKIVERTIKGAKGKPDWVSTNIRWFEYFTDEDTGKKVRIERHRRIAIDGVPVNYLSGGGIDRN